MTSRRFGRASNLTTLVNSGVIEDGEVLRCKDKSGKLLIVGRASADGVELEGRDEPLNMRLLEAEAARLDPLYKKGTSRITDNTFTTASLSINQEYNQFIEKNGPVTSKQPIAAQNLGPELLDDENDEYCYLCALGGELICCETCPAVFHTGCMGLSDLPTDDWFCPACRCCKCGSGAYDTSSPPLLGNDLPIPVNELASPPAGSLFLGSVAEPGQAVKLATPPPPPVVTTSLADVMVANINNPNSNSSSGLNHAAPMQIDSTSADNNKKEPAAAAAGLQKVKCCVSGTCAHLGCLSPQEQATATATDLPHWTRDPKLLQSSQALAKICAKGATQFTTLQDGTQLSIQLIRGAAVADTPRYGPSPSYSNDQKHGLKRTLSAALHVLHSGYTDLLDSRTGGDIISWMVRGASFAQGGADFSTMHTAVLFAGSTLIGAACLRLIGSNAAEIPLLVIRPELRNSGLGTLFLSRVEMLLALAGVHWAVTPAFFPWGVPFMPSQIPIGNPLPQLKQRKWGYTLATPKEMQALVQHRLLHLPGVLLAVKPLVDIQMPKELPATLRLATDANTRELQANHFIKPVDGAGGVSKSRSGRATSRTLPTTDAEMFDQEQGEDQKQQKRVFEKIEDEGNGNFLNGDDEMGVLPSRVVDTRNNSGILRGVVVKEQEEEEDGGEIMAAYAAVAAKEEEVKADDAGADADAVDTGDEAKASLTEMLVASLKKE